jgi:hypothetical protein
MTSLSPSDDLSHVIFFTFPVIENKLFVILSQRCTVYIAKILGEAIWMENNEEKERKVKNKSKINCYRYIYHRERGGNKEIKL